MLWLLACSGPSDVELLAAALEASPQAAVAHCHRIEDPLLRGECALYAAPGLTPTEGVEACGLIAGPGRDECIFRVAEAAGSLTICEELGALMADCRRHVFGGWGHEVAEDQALPEAASSALKRGGGFEPDFTCWSDFFLAALTQRESVPGSACDGLAADAASACSHTVVEIHQRMVRNAHERGELPCAGTLPKKLGALQGDAAFDRVVASARSSGDCAP